MSFYADKRLEHERACEKALRKKEYRRAKFHAAKTADFSLRLAEMTDGKVSRRYTDDAIEWIEIAEKLRDRQSSVEPEANTTSHVAIKEPEVDDTTGSSWQLGERPDVTLDDVAGLDEVKRVLKEDVINACTHPEVYERFKVKPGAGVLMYGPPGNGKTHIARAIAGELDAAFFPVDSAEIKNKYVGETEKNLKRLFEEARQQPRAVLFFDEVDQLLEKRGNRKVSVVTQYLALSDGIVQNENCLLVLGATNKPWRLDEAVLRPGGGRLGTHIYVGLPDESTRSAIAGLNMRGIPLGPDVSFDEIGRRTPGFSGADVAEICRKAKKAAISRQLESGVEEFVCSSDVGEALARIRPSVSSELIEELVRWKETRSAIPVTSS